MVSAAGLRHGAAIAVTLVTAAACSVSGAGRPPASPASALAQAPMVTSAFTRLVVSHPASWRQYFLSPGDSVDPHAAGYLTNEPIPAACRGATPATVVCGQPVMRAGSGGVYITVRVLYQPPAALPQHNQEIDRYPADVVTGADPGTYGCPAATTRVIAAALSRADVQPSGVWIFACLGGPDTGRTQQQVMSMLASARVATRPAATRPVPGARRCTTQDLTVEPGPPLSAMTQERGLIYAVHNTGQSTCRISGYPVVQLSARTTILPFRYQDGGGPYLPSRRPPVLYLRSGEYASFQVDTSACVTRPGTAATTARITLPGQAAATSLPGALDYCAEPNQLVYIGALNAY